MGLKPMRCSSGSSQQRWWEPSYRREPALAWAAPPVKSHTYCACSPLGFIPRRYVANNHSSWALRFFEHPAATCTVETLALSELPALGLGCVLCGAFLAATLLRHPAARRASDSPSYAAVAALNDEDVDDEYEEAGGGEKAAARASGGRGDEPVIAVAAAFASGAAWCSACALTLLATNSLSLAVAVPLSLGGALLSELAVWRLVTRGLEGTASGAVLGAGGFLVLNGLAFRSLHPDF